MPSNNKNNDVNTAIAKKFKMVRKMKELSLVEVGKILRISPQQVQKYEACQSKIPFSRLLIFANALEVSPQFFFENEN